MRIPAIMFVLAMVGGRASAEETSGYVVDHDQVVPHARVRIVGDRVVLTTRADARGHFQVSLPPGTYRIELERGAVTDSAPHHLSPFTPVKPHPFIDATSTASVTYLYFGH